MNDTPLFAPDGSPRREFIKVFAQVTAWFGLCAPVARHFIAEAQGQSANLNGIVRASLAVAPFTGLQVLNGSVRVAVPNGSGITALVAGNNATPSVIITRVATSGNTQFGVVTQRCTHAQQAVSALQSGQSTLVCPTHGSRFNPATGAVTTAVIGGQAGLTTYTSTFTAAPSPGILDIAIPSIGYTLAQTLVPVTGGKRIQLRFPTKSGSTYEVRFRSSLTGTETLQTFFTTQTGTSPVTSIAGTGAILSAFLNPPSTTGFYAILAR
jgi:nitrite reductase/ring-hydroxylating ferredoxin subunit